MDVMDRAISAGRVEELDGTPVFSLVSGPDRALALAAKRRPRPASVRPSGSSSCRRSCSRSPSRSPLDDGRPILFRQTRVGLHGRPFSVVKFRSMVRDAEARRAELERPQRAQRPGVQARRATRASPASDASCAGRQPRRAAAAVERAPRPDEPRRTRGRRSPTRSPGYDLWHRRRLSMKPGITGPVAGPRPHATRTSTAGSRPTSSTSTAGRSGSTSRSCSGRSRPPWRADDTVDERSSRASPARTAPTSRSSCSRRATRSMA